MAGKAKSAPDGLSPVRGPEASRTPALILPLPARDCDRAGEQRSRCLRSLPVRGSGCPVGLPMTVSGPSAVGGSLLQRTDN